MRDFRKIFSKFLLTFAVLGTSVFSGLFAVDLTVNPSDLKIQRDGNGYHVFIRQKEGVNSVLFTETSKDPNGNSDNYAFRAKEWNPVNGDEKRMLNGKFLESEYAKYSLIDSSPEYVEGMGMCFHIYMPHTLVFGYPWSRSGEVELKKGTFINIRTFTLPYADYAGGFLDNPYMLNFKPFQKPKPEPEPEPAPEPKKTPEPVLSNNYNSDAANSFEEIGENFVISHGPETLIDDIIDLIKKSDPEKPYDLVIAMDATGSMKDDVEKLRDGFVEKMQAELKDYKDVQFGLLLYRDYGDTFRYKNLPVKIFPFTKNYEDFNKYLNSFKIKGKEGGDIPEAVYEALYSSMNFYDWREDAQKKIILVGDAQPHPRPRSYGVEYNCTKLNIKKMSQEKDIHIDTIILPYTKPE